VREGKKAQSFDARREKAGVPKVMIGGIGERQQSRNQCDFVS